MEALANWTDLTPGHLSICFLMVFVAGAVRGFAGFGLSAVLMASIVLILPPVELIPLCFLLESAASLAMFRGGFRDADRKTTFTLAAGSAIGVPLGLLATTQLPTELSKSVALMLVLLLTGLQLIRIDRKLPPLHGALPATGIAAGIVTGLASIGGMVVALYVLSSRLEPRRMRASLVLYLFCGMVTSLATLIAFGVLNDNAIRRGLILAPVVLAGVVAGSLLFSRRFEPLYKRVCLSMLLVFAGAGLVRLALS